MSDAGFRHNMEEIKTYKKVFNIGFASIVKTSTDISLIKVLI